MTQDYSKKNQIKEYIKSQEPTFLNKAKHRGWVCPCPDCSSGTGKTGTGMVKIPNSDNAYKCFACGFKGDIFDIVGQYYGITGNFEEKFKAACNVYGVDMDSKKEYIPVKKTVPPTQKPKQTFDATNMIERGKKFVHLTDYYAKRGISEGLVKKFGLGYNKNQSILIGKEDGKNQYDYWECVIIPTSKKTCEVRKIDGEDGERYRKFGPNHIFNGKALQDKEPVFVVEGAFDALSIIEAGGQAISIGSANNKNIQELWEQNIKCPLLIALDSDEQGENAVRDMLQTAYEKDVFAIKAPIYNHNQYHDANDRLLRDRKGLENVVKNCVAHAKKYESMYHENFIKKNYEGQSKLSTEEKNLIAKILRLKDINLQIFSVSDHADAFLDIERRQIISLQEGLRVMDDNTEHLEQIGLTQKETEMYQNIFNRDYEMKPYDITDADLSESSVISLVTDEHMAYQLNRDYGSMPLDVAAGMTLETWIKAIDNKFADSYDEITALNCSINKTSPFKEVKMQLEGTNIEEFLKQCMPKGVNIEPKVYGYSELTEPWKDGDSSEDRKFAFLIELPENLGTLLKDKMQYVDDFHPDTTNYMTQLRIDVREDESEVLNAVMEKGLVEDLELNKENIQEV